MGIDEALGHAWFSGMVPQPTAPLLQAPTNSTSIATTTGNSTGRRFLRLAMPREVPLQSVNVNGPSLPAADVEMTTFPEVSRQNGNKPRVRSQLPMLQPYTAVYKPSTEAPALRKRKAGHRDDDSAMDVCDELDSSGANPDDSNARRVRAKVSPQSN